MCKEHCVLGYPSNGNNKIEVPAHKWQRQGKKLLVASALLSSSLGLLAGSPAVAAECTDTDGDGWGWDGNNTCDPNDNNDAPNAANNDATNDDAANDDAANDDAANDAANDDAANNGSNASPNAKTAISAKVDMGGSAASTEKLENIEPAACTDFDGDGWGWDGNNTCDPGVNIATATDGGISIETGAKKIVVDTGAKKIAIETETKKIAVDTGTGIGDSLIKALQETAANQPAECFDTDGDGFGWDGYETCSPVPVVAAATGDPAVFKSGEEDPGQEAPLVANVAFTDMGIDSETSTDVNVDIGIAVTTDIGVDVVDVFDLTDLRDVVEASEIVEIYANWDSDAQGTPTDETLGSDSDDSTASSTSDSSSSGMTYPDAARNEFMSTFGVPAETYIDPPGQKTYTQNGGYVIAIEDGQGNITGTLEVVRGTEGQTRILSGVDGSIEHTDTINNDGSVSTGYYEDGVPTVETEIVTTETETIEKTFYPQTGVEQVETVDNATRERTEVTTYADRVETKITGDRFSTETTEFSDGRFYTKTTGDGSIEIDSFMDGVRITMVKPKDGPGYITYNGTEFSGDELGLIPNTDKARWEILGALESINSGFPNDAESQLIDDIVDGIVGPIEPFNEWTEAVQALQADTATEEQMALILRSLIPSASTAPLIVENKEPSTAQQAADTYAGGDILNGEYGGTPTRTTAQQAADTYAVGDIENGEYGGTSITLPVAAPASRPAEHKSSVDERQEAEMHSVKSTAQQAADTYSNGDLGGEFAGLY